MLLFCGILVYPSKYEHGFKKGFLERKLIEIFNFSITSSTFKSY